MQIPEHNSRNTEDNILKWQKYLQNLSKAPHPLQTDQGKKRKKKASRSPPEIHDLLQKQETKHITCPYVSNKYTMKQVKYIWSQQCLMSHLVTKIHT